MADFSGVWRCRGSVLMRLEAMLEAREATREQEVTAAAKIQRMYQSKVARGDLNRARSAVTLIAKTFRGYRGRMHAQRALEERQAKETMTVYHHHALVIQGAYRGYQSRKYKYSHFTRKRYLQEVIDKGDAIRAELRRHERQLVEEEAANLEHENRAKFQAIAQNLHHLVSTKTINGVFNSPYHHVSRRGTTTDRIPTFQGVPVEKHLTVCSKDLLRTRGYVKRGLETDLNGQRRVPLRGLKSRRSVQAESPYDAMAQATALEEAFSRLKRIGPREFHAGYRVHLPPYQGGVNTGIPFMDPWRNPYMVRGVPRNQAELSRPIEETSLGKYPEKPFYRSVGGNRSVVLPNGIFDVILDAEQTGGTVRTHNGRARRFGVPDSCDVDDRVTPGATLYFPSILPGKREKSMTIL